MKWSLKLGSFAGIRVYLHWTFVLLLGWILFSHLGQGHDWAEAWLGVGFIIALFGCVLLHEFGHALTAKHYGIRTRDITLLPIGGIARLERLPENPRHELLVTLAGPAVNVVIAAVLWVAIGLFIPGIPNPEMMEEMRIPLLVRLFTVNVWLVLFNMIPAFPMDGGRVLRAVLAMRMNYARATQVAASIGQGIAFHFFHHRSVVESNAAANCCIHLLQCEQRSGLRADEDNLPGSARFRRNGDAISVTATRCNAE